MKGFSITLIIILVRYLLPIQSYQFSVSKSLRSSLRHFQITALTSLVFLAPVCLANDNTVNKLQLSNKDVAQIVADDINIRQALVTADFTPSIYNKNCKFQDPIDVYNYDAYVKGTKQLFNADKSHVDLVDDVIATDDKIEFKFKETLAFNIPFNPKVKLTGNIRIQYTQQCFIYSIVYYIIVYIGHVELSRGEDGLVSHSREYWDKSVRGVIGTARF